MKLKTTEAQVQKSIMDYLSLKGILHWRNNSGMNFFSRNGKDYVIKNGLKGSSDIIGCLQGGRMLAIECKSSIGTLTTEQKDFLQLVNKLGGLAFMARSIDDVMAAGI